MRTSTVVAGLAAIVPAVVAQRPANTSICSYYTTALLTNDTATNQYTLLTLLVNTAVIGNYTTPNVGVSVPGLLNPGMYNGSEVNLLPYFDGSLASTNQGGSIGMSVNFLDGGGAAPLEMNMPANSNTTNQYGLLTHLYQYFGVLLGCDASGYPAYAGVASMASVHRFMDLNYAEVGWFIDNVGLSAASFGVATADIDVVATALETLFDVRCAAPTVVVPSAGAVLNSICQAADCPLAPNSTCSSYPMDFEPAVVNATLAGVSNATSLSNATSTSTSMVASSSSTAYTGAASKAGVAIGAGLLGLAAFAL